MRDRKYVRLAWAWLSGANLFAGLLNVVDGGQPGLVYFQAIVGVSALAIAVWPERSTP